MMKYTNVSMPVGEGEISFDVPNLLQVVEPVKSACVDVDAEIHRAMKEPIGSERLQEIARGKHSAAIIVNDITRPYAGREMILAIAEELNAAGMKDEEIFLVVAYGAHRINTDEELIKMYGEEVFRRFRYVHHDAFDPETLETVGVTDGGVVVEINREFAQAEVKITTGCIVPHQLAGFSGGRKSVIPGIAGFNTLKKHHSFPIRPEETSLGWIDGNPFHEEAMKAARIAGVDFIVNSVDNEEKKMVKCVCGDLGNAYIEGARLSRQAWSVPVKQKADVVIVSPGGYPRDFDLHQSQKAIGCAEMMCKEGGHIILCAEMRDGGNKPGKMLKEAEDLKCITDKFCKVGYTPDALSKTYMFARAMQHFHVTLIGSKIPQNDQKEMFFEVYDSIEQAIQTDLARYGENASFVVMPCASEVIPVFEC